MPVRARGAWTERIRLALRAAPSANTSDLVAEHQTFRCESGAVAGSYDVSGCDHCTIK